MELKRYERKVSQIEEQIAKLVHLKETYTATALKAEEMIPEIEKSLKPLGLTVSDYRYSKTGLDNTQWSEGDTLHVSLELKPIGSKFKFVKFRGYAKDGDSLNKYDRSAKARKIEGAIGHGVQVNDFSLELKRDEETKTILADLWVEVK